MNKIEKECEGLSEDEVFAKVCERLADVCEMIGRKKILNYAKDFRVYAKIFRKKEVKK